MDTLTAKKQILKLIEAGKLTEDKLEEILDKVYDEGHENGFSSGYDDCCSTYEIF